MRKAFLFLITALLSAGMAFAQDIKIITDEEALFGSADELPAGGETAATGGAAPAEGTADSGAPAAEGTAAAGDSMFSATEDELFQGEGVEKVASGAEGAAVAAFLKTDAVRIGGSFTGSADMEWTWSDPWNGNDSPLDPDASALPSTLSALVFFDARPEEDYRVYGSARTSWPFTDAGGRPNIKVFELFSDFNWNDAVFLRFGKHTVKWGVGYFWSPADVINLTSIDVEDPTAQREGPISLRAHFPVPGTQTNLWGYLLVPNVTDAATLEPSDVGAAGKLEFLIGGWEIGTGAFWQGERAPKAMLTGTGSLGRFNLFGEAVIGWGGDKSMVRSVASTLPGFIKTEEVEGIPVFSGTSGFMWTESDWNLSVSGQYFYNGDGYGDRDRRDLIADARSQLDAIKAKLQQVGSMSAADADSAAQGILKGLMVQSGRHYVGLSVSKTELASEDLSLSLLAVANLSDLSGMVTPILSFELFKRMTLRLGATFFWATDLLWGAGGDGEYVVIAGGPAVTLSLGTSLGNGRF